MQLRLVDSGARPRSWTRTSILAMGLEEGDWLPIGDPAFLDQVWSTRSPRTDLPALGEAALVSAASMLRTEFGPEVRASHENLSALALALEITAELDRLLTLLPSHSLHRAAALAECLDRAAALLKTAPVAANRHRRRIELALAPLTRLVLPTPPSACSTLKAA